MDKARKYEAEYKKEAVKIAKEVVRSREKRKTNVY